MGKVIPSARVRVATNRFYFFEALETRTFLAADFGKIGQLLGQNLTQVLINENKVSKTANLPVLNQPFGGGDTKLAFLQGFISPLADGVSGITAQTPAAIRAAVYGVVGPAGLNLLKDVGGTAGVDANDIAVTVNGDNISVKLSLLDAGVTGSSVTPGTGLPGVPLTFKDSSTSKATLKYTSEYDNLTFGWNNNKAFFGVPVPINGAVGQGGTLIVNVQSSLTPGQLDGTLGYFPVSATIDAGNTTELSAVFTMPINTVGVIGTPSLSGSAHLDFELKSNIVNLDDGASFGAPDIKVRYIQDQNFGTASNPNGATLGTAALKPTVSMKTQVGIHSIGTSLLAPLADKLDILLDPIDPVLDILTTPLPVISALSVKAGLGEVTLIDVVEAYVSKESVSNPKLAGLNNVLDAIESLGDVASTIESIENIANLPDAYLDFGEFNLSANGDLRTLPAITYNYYKQNLDNLNATPVNGAANFQQSIINQLNDANAGSLASFVQNGISGSASQYVSYAFALPIFQSPQAIYKLLLGRNSELATFHFNATPPQLKVPLGDLQAGPIKISFAANFGLDINLDLGYDGNGLRTYLLHSPLGNPSDLFQGFYVGANTHFNISGGASVAAGPGIPIFSLQLEGGITATVGLAVNADNQGVGKYVAGIAGTDDDASRVRQGELAGTLFKVGGKLTGFINLVVKIGVDVPVVGFVGYQDSFNLVKATIFSFDFDAVPDPFAPPPVITLAKRLDDGTLLLLTGANASQLEPATIDDKQANEAYSVIADPSTPGTYIVSAYSYSQAFADITGIGATGGDKPMVVTIGQGVDVPVLLVGGSNDDRLTVRGNGNAVLSGSGGDDQITYEGSGRVTIYGGGGNDTLSGGSGVNGIDGGADNDLILGGQRSFVAGRLNDTIVGSLGNALVGGDGNDTIVGGLGARNTIAGGAGDDYVSAGDQGDLIYADELPNERPVAGNDTINAGAGIDSVWGGGGSDALNWSYGDGATLFDADTSNGGGEPGDADSVNVIASDAADAISVSRASSVGTVHINDSTVRFTGVEGLALEAGGGADTVTIPNLFGLGITSLGINLQDVIAVDNAPDVVTIQGAAVAEAVDVWNEGVAVRRIDTRVEGRVTNSTYTYGGVTRVEGLGGIDVARIGNVADTLNLNNGGGNDEVNVYGISGPTNINTAGGVDAISVRSDSPTVPLPTGLDIPGTPGQKPGPRFNGFLSINAGTDTNSFAFGDYTPTGAEVNLGEDSVASTGVPLGLTFRTTGAGTYGGGVEISTGNGKDTVFVQSTIAEGETKISTNGNSDRMVVANSGRRNESTLENVRNRLTLGGGAGTNTFVLDNSGTHNGDDNVYVQNGRVVNFAGPEQDVPVYFGSTGGETVLNLVGSDDAALPEQFTIDSPLAGVQIDANGGDDTIAILTLGRSSTINGGAGADTLFLGRNAAAAEGQPGGQLLDGVAASITFDGGAGYDTATVSDSAGTIGLDYTLTSSGLAFEVGALALSRAEVLNATAGRGSDNLYIIAQPVPALSVDFFAGAGTNRLFGPSVRSSWILSGVRRGSLGDNVTFGGFGAISGGSNYDNFAIGSGVASGVKVTSVAGLDTLDYSAWTSGVTVDLPNGSATGLAGVTNIPNVLGGGGADVLVGDDNRNTLVGNGGNDIITGHGGGDSIVGGNGNDMLIGGNGPDVINGGAGDDLLVDGTTAFDNNTANLRLLLTQWTIGSLSGKLLPGGLTGSNKLFHDNFKDRLTGSTGIDYFFAVRAGRFADEVTDRLTNEVLAS